MLLNEFLKEHHKVEQQDCKIQQQEATIAELRSALTQQRNDFQTTIIELKKDMQCVVAHSKEQDANIRRVSAQIELNSSATRLANDNR
jgi:hypothetical protein